MIFFKGRGTSSSFLMKLTRNLFASQTSVEYLTFAAISKLIAAGATYPYQVVRARLQDQHRSYDGAWHCINETWRYERIRGFYKGLTPYLLHVTPNICLVMLIWEKFTNNDWVLMSSDGKSRTQLFIFIFLFFNIFDSSIAGFTADLRLVFSFCLSMECLR